jgi:GrpB-like predicted nucleotidyltransferase (UPF0157 family)
MHAVAGVRSEVAPADSRHYNRAVSDQRSDREIEAALHGVLIGGIESPAIEVLDYDPSSPQRFAREAATISAALAGHERLIEHIGSTSVPGLAAKPIIDILLVVDNSADEASYLPALEAAGYVLRVREPDLDEHRMLRTPAKDVHVHVFSSRSPEIGRYLMLRDWLRRDAADRELYARTKRRLAARKWPTMDHYAEAKTEVINAILARAAAAQDDGTHRPSPH